MAKFRLQTVLTIAEEREENARKALEKSLHHQRQVEAQRQQLEDYRSEYQKRQYSGIALTPFQWQGYQDFLIRLDQAIEIQKNLCQKAQEDVDKAREGYMKHRRFLKGIEILKERHIQSEQQKQEKMAQKLLDEFAMRKGLPKRSK